MNAKAIRSEKLSSYYDERYVIIDTDSGEILDDVQGYGYRSAQKAYAAYSYKNRTPKQRKEKELKERKIRAWLKSNNDFANCLEGVIFDISAGKYGPEDKVDAKLVKQLLDEFELETEFAPKDILSVFLKMK